MTNVFQFGSCYRVFTSYWWRHWLSPRTYYMPFVWGFQRVTRGWADCDVWSIDSWLCDVIPPAIDKLRSNDIGHPCGLEPEEWCQILKDISDGFRAATLHDHIPDEFVREMDTSTGWASDLGWKDREYDWDKINEFHAVEQAKFEHGAQLFVKYFHKLWD